MIILLLMAGAAYAQDAAIAAVGIGEVGGTVGALTGGGALAALALERWFKTSDDTGDKLDAIEADIHAIQLTLAGLTAELNTRNELARAAHHPHAP